MRILARRLIATAGVFAAFAPLAFSANHHDRLPASPDKYPAFARVQYDYAQVLQVRSLAPPPAPCPRALDDAQAPLPGVDLHVGSVREETPSIASAIMRELEAMQSVPAAPVADRGCARVADDAMRGPFEVVYEYAGQTYRRVLERHPGDRLRVRVEHAVGPR